jgi:hypothetical protein
VIQYRRADDRRSRARRWGDAVAVLVALQDEYAAWLDALSETLRDSATGEALQAIVELDLDELTAAVPPRGAPPVPAWTVNYAARGVNSGCRLTRRN